MDWLQCLERGGVVVQGRLCRWDRVCRGGHCCCPLCGNGAAGICSGFGRRTCPTATLLLRLRVSRERPCQGREWRRSSPDSSSSSSDCHPAAPGERETSSEIWNAMARTCCNPCRQNSNHAQPRQYWKPEYEKDKMTTPSREKERHRSILEENNVIFLQI